MNQQIRDDKQQREILFGDISEIWRDPPEEVYHSDDGEIVRRETLTNALTNILYTEMRTPEMTSLGNILLGRSYDNGEVDENAPDSPLNLSHKKLEQIPKIVCSEFGYYVKTLDISHNKFRKLDFLEHFTELTSLILDRNPLTVQETNIPWMPKLELLYLNFCNIDELYWVESLKYNCPKLRYLSLMGNPVAPSPLMGGTIYEYLRYRLYIISVLTNLVHLDDKSITDEERHQARKMYPTPFFRDLLVTTKKRIPRYLRNISTRMGNVFNKSNRIQKSTSEYNVVI